MSQRNESWNWAILQAIDQKKGLGETKIINLSALVSPEIEKLILFRIISYHSHTKMAKKYEFHTKNEKSYQPSSAYESSRKNHVKSNFEIF